MRWPKLIKAGSAVDQFALNIDIAPTLLEICGASALKGIHGHSLVPLLRGEKIPWRDSFLIEYFSDKVFPRMSNMGYQALRDQRWKYIHYVDLDGMDELYDLRADPYEMNNLAAHSQAGETVAQMRKKLQQLVDSSK
jgi:N-acetylglucosamine-6-sulfatase